MIDIAVIFYTVAVIMLLSFIGEIVSHKILLPNVILLVILGMVCGLVLHLFEHEALVNMVS